ncbi:hypothetical protein GJAV_G00016640 [Gymnothorax javanicus]|nr:hypothetical protein GJAV_G00016640 [Gymnothorax javanicus]
MLLLHNMHPRAKSRSCDNYLSIKDSESLDSCIQSTLSALYPPFTATAPTVLWQLFSVVERQYRGDGLRCLIDFLLPAKRILQSIQQETCVRYKGLLFFHEGWPLCIHEKVVLQLAPLHKVRLKQGDFYFQVVPLGRKSAKLVIKCLSGSGQAIAEVPVEESMYGSIFTADFLQHVTRDRSLHPLQNCLLTTGSVVYRTPWKNIVNPQFVTSTADAIMQARRGAATAFRGQLATCSTSGSTGTLDSSHRSSRESLHSQGADSASSFEPATHKGVELGSVQHSPLPAGGLRTPSRDSLCPEVGSSSAPATVIEDSGEDKARLGVASRTLSFSTDLSNPGPRRRHPRDSAAFEARRLFRKSYMEALQNPMNLGSSSESILEESTETGPSAVRPGLDCTSSTGCASDASTPRRELLPRRIGNKALLGGEESRSHVSFLGLQRGHKSPDPCRSERRSKSLERTNKTTQVKGHRTRSSSGGSSGGSPKKSLNGYSLRFGKLEPETGTAGTDRRNILREDSGLHEDGYMANHRPNSQDIEEAAQSSKPANGFPKLPLATPAAPPTDSTLQLPRLASEVKQDLLESGAFTLPGNRDRCGRSVLQVCTRSQVWTGDSCSVRELTALFSYYYSTLRKEKRDLGLTVLVDARKQQPSPALFSSLAEVQLLLPNALYSVLMLVDKETASKPERDTTIQYELLPSLKALLKYIDASQLTQELEGSFHHDHIHWVQFRRKIEPFAHSCSMAVTSLHNSIATLTHRSNLNTAKEVSEVIEQQKRLMKNVLDDSHLNRLRLEGGTVLARIRKEEPSENENYRDAVDMVSSLYNQVDEEVHKLVILSNKSLQQLENLLEVCRFEEGCAQIRLWFSVEAEKHLSPLDSLTLSLSTLRQMRESLSQCQEEADQHRKQGLCLIQECKTIDKSSVLDFKQYLTSVLGRIERRKSELDVLLNLYEFYDSAEHWAEHCQDYLRQLNLDCGAAVLPRTVLQVLQDYQGEATKFSPDNFSALNEMVLALGSSRQLDHWKSVWHRCQQTRRQLDEALIRAMMAPPSPADFKIPEPPAGEQGKATGQSTGQACVLSSSNTRQAPVFEFDEAKPPSAGPFTKPRPSLSSSSLFSFLPESGKVSQSPSLYDETDSDCTIDSSASCHSEPVYSPGTRHRKQPHKKIMKKTMSFDLSTRDAGHAHEHSLHGYTGVYIKGLEVTNNVCLEKKHQRPDVKSPVLSRSRSMSSPPRMHSRHSEGEPKKQSSKIKHIMEEMIATEREYVRSLGYIIENYFPEMARLDLPQDLRGKRSIIFGNVEKLYDFHSHFFLKELESSAHSPLSISSCFLRHEDQFGMYALYSKNKPQSDNLLASHGNDFFKNKQVELGDRMDLASYLLKPIQRMSKYALLLKDLIKECDHAHQQELSDLRTAEEMVKFQLRHGNDLLAMDAIRGCDVNLKEQGQLRCQDEFIVWCGRRKYLRHVFLFEDLILFSKTKKIDGGYDIYIYKQSYKTAEIGMTENVGDSGLRFEIWFRRRKSQDTFILQAGSAEVKAAWTTIIGKILWRQALRNRELRMQEMVSMGIGNKPFMDIKPSDAAISDRAIDYIMKGSETRTRASIAVSSFDHSTPFKRPHSTISNSSTSSSSSQSSSSLLGSLNLHLYPSPTYPLTGCPSFGHWPYDCIEEDELEQDNSSQPSMITEGSETSSQCASSDSMTNLNGLTGPTHTTIAMETFPNDTVFLSASSSSSSPPKLTSPAPFQKSQDLQAQNNQFITASKTSNITLGLSTVV